ILQVEAVVLDVAGGMRALERVDRLAGQCRQSLRASNRIIDATGEWVSQQRLRINTVPATARYPRCVRSKSACRSSGARSSSLRIENAVSGSRHQLVGKLHGDADAGRETGEVRRPEPAPVRVQKHQAAAKRKTHLAPKRIHDREIKIVQPV